MAVPASERLAGLSPRAREIVDAARALLEERGLDALSMRTLADRVGVSAPALYRHFRDKHEIERLLISQGLWESGDRTLAALRSAEDDGLAALIRAHRAWALEHRALYALSFAGPLDRARLDPGCEEHAGTALHVVTGGDPDVQRAVWAFVHGMIDLERLDRFPPGTDVEAVWSTGIEGIRTQLPTDDG